MKVKNLFVSLILVVLVAFASACTSSSNSNGSGDLGPINNDNGGDVTGPCPDPSVIVAITSPNTNQDEIVIPLGEYTFIASVTTTYPNRTEVVWTIDGDEYSGQQITVNFDTEAEDVLVSVVATCTATDNRTDTDTDSCIISIGEPDETDPADIEAVRGCSGDGFFAVITPITNHLYTWGVNTHGQLGLGDTTDRATPQRVLPDLTDKRWYSVAFHDNTAYATDLNGNIWVWGEGFTSTPVILDNDMWATVDAGEIYVIATNWLNETYTWSDVNDISFDDRSRVSKTDTGPITLLSAKIAGSNPLGATIYKDNGGNLLIVDMSDGDYVPLELGWSAEDYAIADSYAAFIRDGKLYTINDIDSCIVANYEGAYEDFHPYHQYAMETDWTRVYSAFDGIIAVRGTSPERHYYIGDVYPADVYPVFTEIDITTLPEAEQRIINVDGISLYIPDGARF